MAGQQELAEFLQGITNQITGQLHNLSSAVGAHSITATVNVSEGEPTKCKEWIKSIYKYIGL